MIAASDYSRAAAYSTTIHGSESGSLNDSIAVGDAISGLIATELSGDQGWHPANPAATNGSQDPNGLPTFTNDVGGSGLAGLLSDFGGELPVKRIQYDLADAIDIATIQILTGNDGKDGRVFSTTAISVSIDNGLTFSPLGASYFQSDPFGTINSGQWGSTLVTILDDGGSPLASGATNLIFEFYCVDNTLGEYRDPFNGPDPFTGNDDFLTAAFVSPLVWEIDVIAVPEPSTALLLFTALGTLATAGRRRNVRNR